jgi:hypothetical protein
MKTPEVMEFTDCTLPQCGPCPLRLLGVEAVIEELEDGRPTLQGATDISSPMSIPLNAAVARKRLGLCHKPETN